MPTTTTQIAVKPQVTGLDGQTRDWSDVFTYDPSRSHGRDTAAEHIVRQTFFRIPEEGDERPHRDRASFPATGEGYDDALTAARWLRLHTEGGYAVIDTVHACGCRLNG